MAKYQSKSDLEATEQLPSVLKGSGRKSRDRLRACPRLGTVPEAEVSFSGSHVDCRVENDIRGDLDKAGQRVSSQRDSWFPKVQP
jgi:hypothetical protein